MDEWRIAYEIQDKLSANSTDFCSSFVHVIHNGLPLALFEWAELLVIALLLTWELESSLIHLSGGWMASLRWQTVNPITHFSSPAPIPPSSHSTLASPPKQQTPPSPAGRAHSVPPTISSHFHIQIGLADELFQLRVGTTIIPAALIIYTFIGNTFEEGAI
jgi:hypothetical protein